MRFGFVFVEDMNHLDAARFQIVGDQRPMTTPPNCLGAHDYERTAFIRGFNQPLDSFPKIIRFYVIGVTAERLISPGGIFRVRSRLPPTAKFREVLVTDPGLA